VVPEVAVLAGGTGGAKLARGMLDVVGAERLAVIANTGDDIEIYGAHVSPDPDLVCFWLADRIDERGWGLAGDTFRVMDGLRDLGVNVWFNLGDRDLAWCMERRRLIDEGARHTEAMARLAAAIGLRARVLPMSDDPVRTWVRAADEWRSFQEFMIRRGGAGPVEGLEFRGAEAAAPTPEMLAALAGARVIVIGPSNPLASIDPILALPGVREALHAAGAPVVAVSPIVGGEVLKGPTAAFMAFAGRPCSAAGVAKHYHGLLDGLVADEPAAGVAVLQTRTRMDDGDSRRRLAEQVLVFARELAG
jgi:LPPG:FO 2-phospho-L-lactate transferase